MFDWQRTVTIWPSASCKSLTGTPIPFRLPAAAMDIVLGLILYRFQGEKIIDGLIYLVSGDDVRVWERLGAFNGVI